MQNRGVHILKMYALQERHLRSNKFQAETFPHAIVIFVAILTSWLLFFITYVESWIFQADKSFPRMYN